MTPPEPAPRPRTSKLWLGISVALSLVLLVGAATMASMYEQLKAQIVHLQERLAVTPQVRYVSVLLDAQELPALLVTLDPQAGVLQVQRLNEVKEGREDSMQLWALASGKPPRSLGVIESKFKTLQLTAKEAQLAGVTKLAISVESKGGVPEQVGPRLPYLFEGWLIQKAI